MRAKFPPKRLMRRKKETKMPNQFWLAFLALLAIIPIVNSANVYCYLGFGTSPTNGSTLSFQNVCVGNGSCFLIIGTDNSWRSGCTSPNPPSSTVSIPSSPDPYCSANVPTFCRCGTNFCNTPNNPGFLLALNSTLSKIVKPEEPGNMTCFECGTPYVLNMDGSRSLAPFNVICDGSKYCTGKYCVTRKSQYPRSFCATSWEDPKAIQCQKVNDPYDDQECICDRNFCNYPYDPMNPPPPTTTLPPPPPPTTTLPPPPPPTPTLPPPPPPTTTLPPPPPPTTTLPPPTTTLPPPPPPTTTLPSPPPPTTTLSPPPPTTTTILATTSAYVITCPDGRQFGPNDLAVYMGQILKQAILGTYSNAFGNSALDSYKDGINTHICNYMSGIGKAGRK